MRNKFVANIKKSFPTQENICIENALSFIGKTLSELGITKKYLQKTELLSEETISMFLEHAPQDAVLKVKISRFFGDAAVTLSMQGEEFEPLGSTDRPDFDSDELVSENAIRALLLRSHGENFKYRRKSGVNHARILTGQTVQHSKNATFIALFLGLVLGLLAKFVFSPEATEILTNYALNPIHTVFMNALKIIIAPVVFFSIVTCFSQFNNLSELGKVGGKVIGMYLLTTVIAVALSIGVFFVVQPGSFGFALSDTAVPAATVDTDVEYGILPMLMNIVPSNFLAPFIKSDTLQIIFLAILVGTAVGAIGQYSKAIKELFEGLNSLFLQITTVISKFIPFAALASVAMIVINLGGDSILSVAAGAGVHVLTIMLMIAVYGVLILLLSRLNPLNFYKKSREGMLTSFTLSSSSASMPTNLRVATDKLGISPKVANFSIPLGATINMDGVCIFLTILGLFLARAYGVEVTASALLSVSLTIILLSLGAPGVPGAALVCLGVVLETLNVPLEAIGLIIGIAPLLDMFDTMNNTTGDLAAALVVSKSEKLLDLSIYNG